MRLPDRFRPKADRGNSLVEFALISFMFVIVMLGVVEVGRLVLVYTTMANAARAGARYAIVHGGERTGSGIDGPSGPGNTVEVETVVKNYASAGLLNVKNLTVTVSYPNGLNTAGSPVTVSVTYPYDALVGYFTSLMHPTLGSASEGVITF